MPRIERFRDLEVYQLAHKRARALFRRTSRFPTIRTDQVRCSSRAVIALLAVAWARWRYRSAFINKVNQAMGKAMEAQAWIDHARSCGYLDHKKYKKLDDDWAHVGAMLRRMIQEADKVCNTA